MMLTKHLEGCAEERPGLRMPSHHRDVRTAKRWTAFS
jgi:hypothetical protein